MSFLRKTSYIHTHTILHVLHLLNGCVRSMWIVEATVTMTDSVLCLNSAWFHSVARHWLFIRKYLRLQIYLREPKAFTSSHYNKLCELCYIWGRVSAIPASSELFIWFFKTLWTDWQSPFPPEFVLQKVPFEGFSECERTYYGLLEMQIYFTVISTSR